MVTDCEKQTIETVKKIAPAVVSIVIAKHLPMMKDLRTPFSSVPADSRPDDTVTVGGGSGFLVHPDGLILTNKHVVYDTSADYVAVASDGHEYPATVLSRDPLNDIAFVKINGKNMPTVRLGDSAKVELGQTVIAIGNALGMFSNTVSKGIISGLSRSISASLGGGEQTENLRGVIQTDVAINQGNSGGPLSNLNGEVVGINTAVIFGAQNIGFSIPINWAKKDLADIETSGRIITPYLGLQFVVLNNEMQKRYSLPVNYGALVVRDHIPHSIAVVPGSPAHKAGIKENDIILALDGDKVTEEKDISAILQEREVGEEITLTVLHQGEEHKVKTTLTERK